MPAARWACPRAWLEPRSGSTNGHFTGAAEPDPAGLNRGWFAHDASQAIKDHPKHAIYASSFAQTGLSFPMVWSRNVQFVSAVNVTERYTPKASAAETNRVRLLVKVLDRPAGKRVAARVLLSEKERPEAKLEGMSRDESADLNDILPFTVSRDCAYEVRVETTGREIVRPFRASTNSQDLLVVTLIDTPLATLPSQVCYVPPAAMVKLKPRDEARLKKALTEYFAAPANKQAEWKFSRGLEKLLRENEPNVRQAAWEAYRAAPIHDAARDDFATNKVRFEDRLSPYTVKKVGTRPTNGWALFIAMHGGGGVRKEVNDRQWQQMQHYYRDHPEAGGYLYVALRAPNDTWNGFYDTYVYPLVANLVRQFNLFGDIDPNKVFIMGYSHGGYGAYAIGPKMPDRFAAIHASAAAATDGETTAKTLRNTIFTAMVGEKDTMYGRYERNLKFRESLDGLRGDRKDIYPSAIQIIAGNGHTGLPDRDKIVDMYSAVRNPVPAELTWLMTDAVIKDFFWLRCEAPAKDLEIDATCRDNQITITNSGKISHATLFLDQRLIDFDEPLMVELNGRKLEPVKLGPAFVSSAKRFCGEATLNSPSPRNSICHFHFLWIDLISRVRSNRIMFAHFVSCRAVASFSLAAASLSFLSARTGAAESVWKKHLVHEGAPCMTAVAGDFTKDGRPDVIANSGEKTRLFVGPDWKEIVIDATPRHDFIHSETFDVDSDGDLDFIGARYQPGLIIWLEQPDRPLTEPWPLRIVSQELNGIHGLLTGDVDRDGRIDLIANSAQPIDTLFPESLLWLAVPKNPRSARSWVAHAFADKDAPGLSHYLGFGDVNGDGRPDAATGAKGEPSPVGNFFAWWEAPEDPTKAWKKRVIAEKQFGATNIHPGDVNRDGKTDFIASRGHGNGVVWFEAPSWREHPIHATLKEPHSLIVLDMDGDGDLDAATCAYGDQQAWWFENDGKGNFTNHLVARNQEAYDIRAFDMDRDGDLDLVIAGRASNNVAWYENPRK